MCPRVLNLLYPCCTRAPVWQRSSTSYASRALPRRLCETEPRRAVFRALAQLEAVTSQLRVESLRRRGSSRNCSRSRADTVASVSRKIVWTAVALLVAVVVAALVVVKFLEFVASQN